MNAVVTNKHVVVRDAKYSGTNVQQCMPSKEDKKKDEKFFFFKNKKERKEREGGGEREKSSQLVKVRLLSIYS